MIDIYSELEKYLKTYVENADVNSIDDLKFIKRLNDIIYYSGIKNYSLKYKTKQDFKKINKLVLDFLEELNVFYKDYYQTRLLDGTFIFDTSKKDEPAYSDYDAETDTRIIYIALNNTVYDAFAIIHELFHDINIDIKESSFTRQVFTESLSFLAEFLLEDFLKNKDIKDYQVNNNKNIKYIWYKSLEIDFNLQLISSYIEKRYLDEQIFNDIIKNYNKDEIEYIELVLEKMIDEEELTIDYEQGYIIGIFIATYMYDRIINNKKNIKEVFELNEMLKFYTIEQVFDYLGLDYDDGDLTDKSYIKLKNSYKKYLKRR